MKRKNLKEAILYKQLEGEKVQCTLCPLSCVISKNKRGICKTRTNFNGKLYSTTYGIISAAHDDPIEKKPLYHFAPGSKTLSLGSLGCNFNCPGCQNWQISQCDPRQANSNHMTTPSDILLLLQQTGSAGLSLTYNEPAIWLEFAIDCFKLAKQNGYYTVFVTNGFINLEALNKLSGILDAYRVDIKGFSEDTYEKISERNAFEHVLKSTLHAKKLNMHIECVTNIHPGINDNLAELRKLALWIKTELGELTPWHITAFSANNRLEDIPSTSTELIEEIMEIGTETGLKYVYPGNLAQHQADNTFCHNCKQLVIGREARGITTYNITDGKCTYCESTIPGRMI